MAGPFVIADVEPNPLSLASGNSVFDLVSDGWNNAQLYADAAVTNANIFLTRLSDLAAQIADLPTVDGGIGAVDQRIDDLVIPDEPTMLALPSVPTTPGTEFSWTEPDLLHSTLLTAMRSQLLTWVQGASTGLDATVEARLWERMRNREHVGAQRAVENATRQAAARGWRRPPGAMFVEIDRALQDQRVAVSGGNREVAIKQAELEQANRQFAFKLGWDVEGGLLKFIGESRQRSLEAAKFMSQLVNEVFKVHVEAYRAEIGAVADLFKAEADVFSSIITGRSTMVRAQADVYKAKAEVVQIEATTRIEAAKANIAVMIQKFTLLSEAIKAGAQVSAQIAASALSAVNLSGGVSAGASYSNSVSNSSSRSESNSYSNSVADSDSRSYSYSYDMTKGIMSLSKSENHSYDQTKGIMSLSRSESEAYSYSSDLTKSVTSNSHVISESSDLTRGVTTSSRSDNNTLSRSYSDNNSVSQNTNVSTSASVSASVSSNVTKIISD